MKARVHTNGSLTILPQLFKLNWGGHRFPHVNGTCILLQTIYAVEIQTGLKAKVIAEHLQKAINRQVDANGLSLGQLAKYLQPLLNDKQLGAQRLPDINTSIAAMKEGRTVVAIFNAMDDLDVVFSNREGIIEDYCVRYAQGPKKTMLHSILLAGVDEENGHAIFRDSRPSHFPRMKGFAKYPVAALTAHPNAMAYVELVVH